MLPLCIILIVLSFTVDVMRVNGNSMEPELENGSVIIVINNIFGFFTPKKGDFVVFTSPVTGELNIKCCLTVENDEVFVTGTNLSESTDSRHFGRIAVTDIEGWAWIKI